MDSTTTVPLITPPPLVVPPRPSEPHGVVYTRPWVVEFILDLAGYRADANLVDAFAIEPAAGNGAFLLPMVRRLLVSCRRQGRPIMACQASLVALELDTATATETRQRVRAALIADGVAPDDAAALATAWIRAADALLEMPRLPPADFVIGNPPYTRLEDVDAATMARYRAAYRTMVGRADLYIPFFEAALTQLKPGGVCAYICADRWMRNQYGAELRRLVTTACGVEAVVEMHHANAFEAAVSAYPAIVVLRKGTQGVAVVASAGPDAERAGSTVLADAVTTLRAGRTPITTLPGWRAARVECWFAGTAPWPCGAPDRLALLKHLEAEFYPLQSVGTGTAVTIGVATGADDVFITTDPNLVEHDRLLPLALAADTVGGQLRWSGHYLVNPWNGQGLVELTAYPRLRAYLEGHRARLAGRHVGQRQPARWYRTIDRVDPRLVTRPKLYIADINNRLTPVLDLGTTYPHHNLYVVHSVGWDPEVLGGLLLSDVAQFFVECYAVRMRGGYLRFQAQYLRRIRVPRPLDLTPAQRDGLRAAFHRRDRTQATALALALYGIDELPREE